MKYFYADSSNQTVGPLEIAEIARLAATGVINDQTHVIAEGSQTWIAYGQLRASLAPPASGPVPPPPAPAIVRQGLGKGVKLALASAAAALVVVTAGAVLWLTVLNRPSHKAIADYVSTAMAQHDLRLKSITSKTEGIGAGRMRVSYVAELATIAPLYTPVDTREYLQDQYGLDATKLAAAQMQARNIDPTELASIGAPPSNPLSVIVLKTATPAGTAVTCTGTLLATKSSGGWSFAEDQEGQYSPQAPEGAGRGDIQGQTYVVGDPADAAALKALVDQASGYADKVAQAMPAGLPAGVKTVVKLAKAGVGEDAMLVQAHSDGTAYKLTADQILYISKAGVPQSVIKALIDGNPAPTPTVASGPAATPALAETVQLPARTPWCDTGIAVSANETVTITASGTVYVGALNGLAPDYQTPAGMPGLRLNVAGGFLAPDLPVWSLIGRIGLSGPAFEVGPNLIFTAGTDGELYLSVNDSNFSDNGGSWTVTVAAGDQTVPNSAAAPEAAEAPPQPVVVAISVPANVLWVDTGVDLAPGETVSVSANGIVSVNARIPLPINLSLFGRQVGTQVTNQTPDGSPSASSSDPFHPYVAPGLPAWSLVGRVDGSVPFEIGSNATFNAPGGGRLFLSVNANSFESNAGAWNVTLTLPPAIPAPAGPPAQVTFDYFHGQLAPYGNWVQVDGYGWCWSPGVAAADAAWRPYCDQGRWTYTDEGWFWQSDYPWGDIAFHYGRWYRDASYGWLWMPDYTWAPAWVCWRNAESLGYCGWAPLPPGAQFVAGVGLMWGGRLALDADFGLGYGAFVFIGFNHFWAHDYRYFLAGRDRADFFFRRSVIRNGYRMAGGHFIVDGLGRDRIGRLTHRHIRTGAVRDVRAREEQAHFDARRPEAARAGSRPLERSSQNRGPQARPSAAKPAPGKSPQDSKKKQPNQ